MKRTLLLITGLALSLLSGLAPAVSAQQIGSNFTGSSFFDAGSLPPDTNGTIGAPLTIGPDAGIQPFAEFLNGQETVYNAQTGAQLARTDDATFWTSPNYDLGSDVVTDPRIVFDPSIGRWLASSLTVPTDASGNAVLTPNRFLVAVSNSADPTDLTGGWTKFALDANPATGSQNLFADFDQLGLNGDNLYLGANMYGGSTDPNTATLQSTSFLSVPLASLIAATPSTLGHQIISYADYNATGPTAHPVLDMNYNSGAEYVLSDFNTNPDPNATALGTQIQVSTLSGTTITTAGGTVTVSGGLSQPLSARQPDGASPLVTNDAGFSGNVVLQNGEIWGVQTVSTGGRDALRWVRIDAATKTLIGEGLLGDPNHDYFFGSVAVNSQGSVVIACTRSGPDAPDGYASSVAFVGHTAGTQTAFGDPLLLQAGLGTFDLTGFGVPNRWGDYSTTTIDPSDPTKFWTIQEWASGTDPDIGIDNWSTQITEITVLPAPEPGALTVFSAALFTLAALRRRSK